MAVKVFFCYAHEDESLLKKLKAHLRPLERQGLIDVWHDRDISAGSAWEYEISQYLDSAQIILLLVSPDFMDSEYCYSVEMKKALERHERKEAGVIPIILRPVDWHSAPFGKLQALPEDGKPVTNWSNLDEAFLDIARGIRKTIEELNPSTSTTSALVGRETILHSTKHVVHLDFPRNPYRGLSAFREEDELFFFGREAFTDQLVEAVCKKTLVTIIGPSGSGKSSVVYAGLIPHLRKEEGWLIATFRPGSRPFHALAASLIPLLEPNLSETDRLIEINKLAKLLREEDFALHDVIERLVQKCFAIHLLLVADQFEELYTLCRDTMEQRHFLDRLLTTVQVIAQQHTLNFHVIIALRADFFGHALSYGPFADALQQFAPTLLVPMNRQELQDTIKKPAAKLSVQVEEGLTERILEAVSKEPGNLPLLEFSLTLLWKRQRESKLTHAVYDEMGGVEEALAVYADEVYSRFNEEQQKQIQQIFIQLVRPGDGTEDTRRLAIYVELGEKNRGLVRLLSDARLVVSGRDEASGKETVEIAHEALIKKWKRLGDWMNEDRTFRIWQERLRAAIRQWEMSQKDEGALWRGALLIEAKEWLSRQPIAISSEEKMWIEASQQYEVEAKERLTQPFKQLDRLKDQFIITASHEMRTPLTAVQGYIELLSEYNLLLTPEARGEFIAKAHRACDELVLMIGNIMDASQVKIDAESIRLSPLSLSESVLHTLEILEAIIKRENRAVEVNIPSSLLVTANDLRLRQVLLNLVSNALKYSSAGSPIAISADQRGEDVTLHVRDFGPGVSPEDQQHLFERFMRLERDMNGPVRGAGLGLSISKQLIEAMGGRIWVESTGHPGEGSDFAFTLKCSQSDYQQSQK